MLTIDEKQSSLDAVHSVLYKFFPLNFSRNFQNSILNQMLTINEFKEYTDELVKDYQEQYENPIEAIIMATFELCEHYNLYKTKIEYARTRNSYESFRKFFTPNSPLENKIDDFFQETAECYEKDL
ncbi:MAG: hypothetical protein IKN43_08315, partial [Selenomonadaceae bacterium]|nr:hypothetical protein [Selenomonadaceae bacterium]